METLTFMSFQSPEWRETMKKEKIFVQVEYEIEYETEEGAKSCIEEILKNVPIKITGAHISEGSYVITRCGNTKLVDNPIENEDEQCSNPR